jgi:ATP-dependent DNA helicase RecG
MPFTLSELHTWMNASEDEHLEFKEAKASYSQDKAIKYCCALANEGGGRLILGVTDQKPRQIVGSSAFPALEAIRAELVRALHLRIPVEGLETPQGRVVLFDVPSHPLGLPLPYDKTYWCRQGEELAAMKPHQLQQIFDETGPDFSAGFCQGATSEDLDPAAIQLFRERWAEKDRNPRRLAQDLPHLLEDAELLDEGQLTYAALILLGTRKALNRHLGQSEVIFEYRSGEAPGPAQERQEFREGALLFLDRLWELVSKRNDLQSWQDGLFMKQVPTFNEGAVREAILNAIAHRDYRLHGSVFVRQYPRRIRVESPGGFLPGITPETILHKQAPRNRRLAEALGRCGLVERSGQGYNRIMEACILESKPRPCFDGTDDYQVFLTLDGQVQDVRFLRLLEAIGQEQVRSFDTDHLMLLDLAYRQQAIPSSLRPRVHELLEAGILEHVGRKIIPSRRLMTLLGEKGKYTRLKGLERPAQRELILQHIRESEEGARFEDLEQVLPGQPGRAIKGLLQTMKAEGLIHTLGKTRGARWFPGPASNPEKPNS